MNLRESDRPRSAKRFSRLIAAVAVLLTTMGIGMVVTAPAANAVEWADCKNGGTVSFNGRASWGRDDGRVCRTVPLSGADARWAVHHLNHCGDAICTIQPGGSGTYVVWSWDFCDVFELSGFGGEWDTHNWGSMTVRFYGKPVGGVYPFYADYRGGSSYNVNWSPIWALKTCHG